VSTHLPPAHARKACVFRGLHECRTCSPRLSSGWSGGVCAALAMILKQNNNLSKDEDEHMEDSFYSFRRLLMSHSVWAPFSSHAVATTFQVEFVFLSSYGAFTIAHVPIAVICGIFAIGMVAYWLCAVVVLILSIVRGKLHKRMHRRALIFYSWWPILTFVLCSLSAVLGCSLGHLMWYTTEQPYYELDSLQPYSDVNPAIVPGKQMQDAGLVDFSDGVGVDRSKGGCFVSAGHTYCVAPILFTGELLAGLGNTPTFGTYDYFAVGVDCCTCPNTDFRCGDWKNPLAQGGMRSLDYRSRPFYTLAVNDWEAVYLKESRHPLFFDWVQNPHFQSAVMWHTFSSTSLLACLAPFPAAFLLTVLAANALRILVQGSVASPLDVPKPPKGLEKAWKVFFPQMLDQYEEEREQLMAMPITAAPDYGAMLVPKPVVVKSALPGVAAGV